MFFGGGDSLHVCVVGSRYSQRETLWVYVVCEWFVCVHVWVFGRMQTALPAQGSAAKTIICDRSARVDSLLRDSLTLSDDQNRKKLTGRRVKASKRGTQAERWSPFLTVGKCTKKTESWMCVSVTKSYQGLIVILTPALFSLSCQSHRKEALRFVSQVIIRLAASQSGVMHIQICPNPCSWNVFILWAVEVGCTFGSRNADIAIL